MASHAEFAAAEIDRVLEATAVPGSPNRFTAQEVRDLALEYLCSHDEELKRFPEQKAEPHWDLWMNDSNYDDALFAVMVFHPTGVEFFCGTGNSFDVRHFAGHDFPENPMQLESALRSVFRMPEPAICLDCAAAQTWLGRAW